MRLARILSGADDATDAPASRLRKHRLLLAGVAALLLILAAVLAAALLPRGDGTAPASSTSPNDASSLELLFEPSPIRSRFVPALRLQPPYVARDAVSVDAGDGPQAVRLAFVDGLVWGAICQDREGLLFSCGLQARAELANSLGNGPAICQPVFYWRDETRYQCFGASGDLARAQVEAGFAKPDPMGISLYAGTASRAAVEARGAWNGGWTIREVR
ncbi:hypothetical protein [Lutibaculum baratangense]|uniref:Uncharacterized protein n=1 Tax=Lutibaculum baratangense AMV1 TaxID=631454 RepID=V4RW29_9HYPH|nr:hypothetical protein [Lutibaculum baratangense]ESR27240.1 hypothetical protein N177_0219 [Lutibaculum baratangense AMV1]